MTNQHPITPPPELRKQWQTEVPYQDGYAGREHWLMERAAQWGADQELEACCAWLREAKNHGFGYEYGAELARKLRATLRPKPPSLKEQGLQALEALQQRTTDPNIVEPLRRALEAIPDD